MTSYYTILAVYEAHLEKDKAVLVWWCPQAAISCRGDGSFPIVVGGGGGVLFYLCTIATDVRGLRHFKLSPNFSNVLFTPEFRGRPVFAVTKVTCPVVTHLTSVATVCSGLLTILQPCAGERGPPPSNPERG
jgi:hypothetical protein